MSLLRKVVHALPPRALPPIRKAYCALHGWGDAGFVARTGFAFLPPSDLRFHVGSVRCADYLRIGQRCMLDMERALGMIGRSFGSFEHALDFGCGTGRTLVWLRDLGPRLVGTDMHRGCVEWASRELGFAELHLNLDRPPLDFAAESFDLVFSLSVFTHLDEAGQCEWLSELRRVSRPGAILLLSTHGPSCTADLSPADIASLELRGFLAVPARGLWGVFDRYFNSYHLEEWVRRVWGKSFLIRAYLPRGLNDHQDLYVMESSR